MFPDVGVENEVCAAIRNGNVRRIRRDMDRCDTAAVFQLRLFEELIVNRVAFRRETDIAGAKAKRIVRGRPISKPSSPSRIW